MSRTASKAFREGLRHRREITIAKATREALRIVQGVLKESLGPNGLTTAEIFNLATRKSPPSFFKPAYLPWTREDARPPNPSHPVRSMRYLKTALLPILEGNGVIRMKPVTRTPVTPSSSSTTSPPSTLSQNLFAWIPVDPDTVPKPKIPEPPIELVGSAVGVGEDWSHLNTRRKRARVEKVAKDYEKMKEVLKKLAEKKKSRSKTLSTPIS
ncbi:hypothetical protein JOM56_012058 [Amanita muscaria]